MYFRVNMTLPKAKGVKTMTREYAENKANILVRDHNHYKKVGYTEAADDYKTALDNLLHVANRKGYNMAYRMTRSGYIHMV